ncbi:toxic anion resistance protein [uncultured Adlercreutzia sp.]|uniref:toxic anion resistance protein n=1 Tax=uncultured Adlercreutzia sp. TaxID=875803 RepID=UPI0025FAA3A4|nr:toxic anion resistance protein [uncultured Adlercreutzia sp.]MCI9261301.1 toxic anion resistance protein [Eggerthellaceae bacterium]
MNDELKNLDNIPTPKLTLEPVEEVTEAAIIETEAPEPAAPSLADSLSAEELAQVEAFAQQIDIANSQQVLTFGSGAQKKMASFSETALEKVRTQDLGEAGDLIANVVTELKSFDTDDEEKGFFGLFKRQANKIVALKARYDAAEANVDKIAKALEGHQVTLMKDAAMLDQLYELNLTYFKELTMYLLAGRQRLAQVREGDLAELSAKAQASGSTEDAEAVQKLAAACNRFEKKLSDLDLSRTVAMQMAPQIRLVQNNEMLMIEKIQTTLVNTIPLWKSQMVLALGLANNEAALRAQSAVTDMTNELLRKNAEKLKQSTVDVARESERGIVDIETLRVTNENLIQTFDEVMKIQAEGRAKRAEAETEMRRMEAELRAKMLEVR